MRLKQLKCHYCRQSALSWLHHIALAAFAVTTIFYLMKFF